MVKVAQGSRATHEEDALSDNMSITGSMDPSEGTDLETAAARVTLAEVDLPEGIRDNLTLFLRLVRKVPQAPKVQSVQLVPKVPMVPKVQMVPQVQ